MKTIIINIGNELLNGSRRNSNADLLIETLTPVGAEVIGVVVVGDDEREMTAAIVTAASRAGLIILTGGLGPTADDLTRQVLAKAVGARLVMNHAVERSIKQRFVERGVEMPAINLKQAMVPQGGVVIENNRGTAPGVILNHQGVFYVALPGPPAELQPMVEGVLKPLVEEKSEAEQSRRWRTLRTCGLSESALCEKIEDLFKTDGNPSLSVTAHPAGVDLRITASADKKQAADAIIDSLEKEIRKRLKDNVYGRNSESLEQVVGRMLDSRNMTIGVAESCTGGLLGFRLSAVAGSSRYFKGGIIAYSNSVKTGLLGIPEEILAEQGAVCAEVAEKLAMGVIKALDVKIGIGITGIAGPDGGTSDKPVGTIFICVADRDGANGTAKFTFNGDRESIRWRSSQMALDMVRRMLV